MTTSSAEYQRAYRAKHPERARVYARRYRETHREAIREKNRRYAAAHRDQHREYNRARYHRTDKFDPVYIAKNRTKARTQQLHLKAEFLALKTELAFWKRKATVLERQLLALKKG